jgi:hypothetical protein
LNHARERPDALRSTSNLNVILEERSYRSTPRSFPQSPHDAFGNKDRARARARGY